MMPSPTNTTPCCSRTPCQTNQAPPISAKAAMTNSPIDCRTCTYGLSLSAPAAAPGPADPYAGRQAGRSICSAAGDALAGARRERRDGGP